MAENNGAKKANILGIISFVFASILVLDILYVISYFIICRFVLASGAALQGINALLNIFSMTHILIIGIILVSALVLTAVFSAAAATMNRKTESDGIGIRLASVASWVFFGCCALILVLSIAVAALFLF